MKLVVERDAAAEAVGAVRGVVKATNTIPILGHLMLHAHEGRLTVTASDMEIETTTYLAANIETGGAITVPAARLHDLLRNIPAGAQVAMELTQGPTRLTVKAGRSRFQLPTLPPGDFPVTATGEMSHQAALPAATLARLIDRTAASICRDSTRYYMQGVYLHTLVVDGERRLRACSTDGGRLAYAEAPCPEGWADAPGITIPEKAVSEIRRLIEGKKAATSEVSIWTNGSRFGVEAAIGATLHASLVAGNFPDYLRVIPNNAGAVLKLDVTDAIAALKRCAVMTSEKSRPVRLALGAGDGLTLTARDSEGGEAQEALDADYDGPAIEFGINSGFLTEALAQMTGEEAWIELGGVNDPMKIVDPKDAGVAFILMPLRG